MPSTRREFLKRSVSAALGASALGIGAVDALGAPFLQTVGKTASRRDRPTLVIIYLRGGADPLNTIIPYADPNYYKIRPTIGVASPRDADLPPGTPASIPVNRLFAFHPALAEIADLYRQGLAAAIINTGSTHETRSHFDAQDFMEWAAPGVKSMQEGWLNRYLQTTWTPEDHFLRAFSPQPLLPRSLRGEYSVLAAPGPGSEAAIAAFEELYPPCEENQRLFERRREEERRLREMTPAERKAAKRERRKAEEEEERPPVTGADLRPRIENAGVNTIEKLRYLNRILATSKSRKPEDGGYPRGRLSQQLADIATVIKAGEPLEISAVDYGGWDHHSYQGGGQGQMANMLAHLSQSIAAFVRDIGPERLQNVMILTMTEFGRTARENGSQGSDHGHGGFMLAVGGRVTGGKIYGKWTGLEKGALYRERDLPVYTDFRDVFAETLAGLFRFDSDENEFFPEYRHPLRKPLGFVREPG